MTVAIHSQQTVSEGVHIPYNWSYADAAARTGATVTGDDVGKLAHQQDDDSLWLLTAATPTWVKVGGGGGATDLRIEDAVTNALTEVVQAYHNSTGTVAVGFGTAVGLYAETSTTEDVQIGQIGAGWTSPVHASRRAHLSLKAAYVGNLIEVGHIEAPAYASVAPNARGTGAVEIHGYRSVATQVASGKYATMIGGKGNIASGYYSTVVGGTINYATYNYATISGGRKHKAYANYATIGGGYNNYITTGLHSLIAGGYNNYVNGAYGSIGGGGNNQATGAYSRVGGGWTNYATGNYSAISGGGFNQATGVASIGMGFRAIGRFYGGLTHAAGRFTVDGDAQRNVVVGRIQTTDASATEVFLDGSAQRITLQNDSAYVFRGKIVARNTSASEVFGYIIEGVIKRDATAASTTLVNSTVTTLYEDDAAYAVTLSADTTNGALKIEVTGAAGDTVKWVVMVELLEVIS